METFGTSFLFGISVGINLTIAIALIINRGRNGNKQIRTTANSDQSA